MRLVIHDYPGHAFPVQLSRALAKMGHDVWHVWSSDIEAPRGPLNYQPTDPKNFHLLPISLGKPLAKYNLIKRLFTERSYARALIRAIEPLNVDVILSNPSPIVQGPLLNWCKRQKIPLVSWLQDLYYIPVRKVLVEKFWLAGYVFGWLLKVYELSILRRSQKVVLIADSFKEFLSAEGLPQDSMVVIPNWAILEEMPVRPKQNEWTKKYDLSSSFVYLYSGTLGLKHNPQLLIDLALSQPEAKIVVVTQGLGRNFLEKEKCSQGIDNLILLDYQPFEVLPDVLGASDVLVVLLEKEAGVFSVPSKVLNYFCAGKPVLGAIPLVNAAAQNILAIPAGKVVEPDNMDGFVKAAEELAQSSTERETFGKSGRKYAEHTFDITKIGSRFETIFKSLMV